MKKIVQLFVLVCMLTAPAFADSGATRASGATPFGQIVNIKVTGGYHLGLFIVLNGNLDFNGGGAPDMQSAKTFMWVNNFSAMAAMDGKFSLMFPIASLPPVPLDSKGTVVTITAFQDKYNVTATSTFDLSQLNHLIHADLTPAFIRQIVDATR